jgi:hypothetical protein
MLDRGVVIKVGVVLFYSHSVQDAKLQGVSYMNLHILQATERHGHSGLSQPHMYQLDF